CLARGVNVAGACLWRRQSGLARLVHGPRSAPPRLRLGLEIPPGRLGGELALSAPTRQLCRPRRRFRVERGAAALFRRPRNTDLKGFWVCPLAAGLRFGPS